MQTNFFQHLCSMQIEGDWKLTIKTGAHNRILVSLLLENEKVGDAAKKIIPPLVLKGTAQEIDERFFEAIKTPIQKTAELLVNMEEFEKALDKAKLESKMEQHKKDEVKKQKDEQQKKYDAAMKKVKELEEAGKHREAYAQLPTAEDHPQHAEIITNKKQALAAKFEQTQLF